MCNYCNQIDCKCIYLLANLFKKCKCKNGYLRLCKLYPYCTQWIPCGICWKNNAYCKRCSSD